MRRGRRRTVIVGSANSGAVVEWQNLKFLHTQGPSGPGLNCGESLRFCAPEILQHLSGERPRKRGPGKGEYGHGVPILSRPRRRFAQSIVAPGEAQRSGFAGKRRSKEAVAVFAVRRKRRQADFATTSRRGQSNPPSADGGIPPRHSFIRFHTLSKPPKNGYLKSKKSNK